MQKIMRKEISHLIFLLNNDYKKTKQLRNKILSTVTSFRYPKITNLNEELDVIKKELAANRLLVSKLEDLLLEKNRFEEVDEPNFLGEEANRHLKLLTTKPQNETD